METPARRHQPRGRAPAPLSIDHPVQVDLAEAADVIEALYAAIRNSDDAHWTTAMRAAMAKATVADPQSAPKGDL